MAEHLQSKGKKDLLDSLRGLTVKNEPRTIKQPYRTHSKKPPYGNPLVSHKFGADPYALVYNDRVYLYATNDEFEYDEQGNITENKYGNINTLTVISSS